MGRKQRRILLQKSLPEPDAPVYLNQSAFRVAERAFKRRIPCLCDEEHAFGCCLDSRWLETAIDPQSINFELMKENKISDERVSVTIVKGSLNGIYDGFGDTCNDEKEDWWIDPIAPEIRDSGDSDSTAVIQVPSIPGLYIIPNPFTPRAQRRAVRACLSCYPKPPNVTNLDKHYLLPSEGLWTAYKNWCGTDQPEPIIPLRRKYSANSEDGYSNNEDDHLLDTPLLKPLSLREAVHKFRWASVGLYYDWSVKSYKKIVSPDGNSRDPLVPPLINGLTRAVVKLLEPLSGFKANHYRPEAGIVNYYGVKDALMAHQDRSEEDASSPLVSISLGNACVFLIGTEDRDEKPVPIILRSGDVVVLSGPCRRAYHGVPRIIERSLPGYLGPSAVINPMEEKWDLYGDYMQTERLNINVRQVFP